MKTFWDILKEYLFVVEDKENKVIYKTDFGINIIAIKQQLTKFTLQQIISYIYSRKYNCDSDIIKLFAMHSTVRSIKDIMYIDEVEINIKDEQGNETKKMTYQNKLEGALNFYGSDHGDSDGLIKMSNDIIKFFTVDLMKMKGKQSKSINEVMNYKESTSIIGDLQIEKRKFINGIKTNDYSGIDSEVLYNLLQMYNTNKLSISDKLPKDELDSLILSDTYISNYIAQFKEKEYEEHIKKWCEEKHLNYKHVITFFNTYCKLSNDIVKYENKIIELDKEIVNEVPVDLLWFSEHTPQLILPSEVHESDLIKISLLQGYGYNLVRNIAIINNNYYYISVFNPYVEYIYKIGKLFKPKTITNKEILNNTLIYKNKLGSTLLYISKKEDDLTGDEDINFIDNIKPSIISKVLPQMLYDNKKYSSIVHEEYVRKFLNKLVVNKKSNTTLNRIISKYVKTIENIKMDLFNNYDRNAFEKLTIIIDITKGNQITKKVIIDLIVSPEYGMKMQQVGGNIRSKDIIHINNSYVRYMIDILNR